MYDHTKGRDVYVHCYYPSQNTTSQCRSNSPSDRRRNAMNCTLRKVNSLSINKWPLPQEKTQQDTHTWKKWTLLGRQPGACTGGRRSLVWKGRQESHPRQVKETIFNPEWWPKTLPVTHIQCGPRVTPRVISMLIVPRATWSGSAPS